MAIIGHMEKQPVEVLDYDVDFTVWVPAPDYILSVASTVKPSGELTIDQTDFYSGSWVKVWLSGGTDGKTYTIELTATTNDGRVKQTEFIVKVKEI